MARLCSAVAVSVALIMANGCGRKSAELRLPPQRQDCSPTCSGSSDTKGEVATGRSESCLREQQWEWIGAELARLNVAGERRPALIKGFVVATSGGC